MPKRADNVIGCVNSTFLFRPVFAMTHVHLIALDFHFENLKKNQSIFEERKVKKQIKMTWTLQSLKVYGKSIQLQSGGV